LGEFSVGLAARRDVASCHNQQRSVEEGRSLLGDTHAMKSVKPSVDILEGLSTGFNMDFSAPHLIHKWFTGHSRPALVHAVEHLCCFFCAPRPSMP
jgi:hypothetical protein